MDNVPGGARTLFAGGGRIYGFNNITTAPQVVVNANPQRKKITFHNPGPNDIIIAPAVIQNSGSAPMPSVAPSDNPNFAPALAALGGCLRVFANGGQTDIVDAAAQQSWQAFAIAGAANPLTVLDTNA